MGYVFDHICQECKFHNDYDVVYCKRCFFSLIREVSKIPDSPDWRLFERSL